MNPRLRQSLYVAGVVVLAVWLSVELADGSYFWPAVAMTLSLAFIFSRLWHIEADVILLGLVVIGYLVGSRGFAQLTLIQGTPVLPAEIALGVALVWRTIRCAFEKRLPVARDALNWSLLAWLLLGGVHLLFDLPRFGFLAVRDSAMVYYALFFFLTQHMCGNAEARRYLLGCVLAGVIGSALLYPLTNAFPALFLQQLVIHGVPLIYYKEDILQTFFAAGGLLLFYWTRGRQRYWSWPLASLIFLVALSEDVRAAMVGGLVALALLTAARRWQFVGMQVLLGFLALTTLLLLTLLPNQNWAGRKLEDITARAATIYQVEIPGTGEAKGYKVDNNRFRLVWWWTVTQEVWEQNPVFGLGFGYDLSAGFLRDYDQELGEEFLARSPHSIVFSALGRMGLAGLAVWLWFCAAFARRCWQALRSAEPAGWGLWSALVVVLVSAGFGVVLEGPMGAVPFWVLLGLAHAQTQAAAAPAAVPEPAAPTAALREGVQLV